MKILLVGQFKSWALENHYARYLRSHADVAIYPAEDVFDDYYWGSKLNKIAFKLGVAGIYKKIARELLERVETEKPDLVWVFKGMRILPEVLKRVKKTGVKIANYNPDHPFLFSTAGSGNRNVTQSLPLFDLHLCYSREVQRRIEADLHIPTAFLPFGFELDEDVFNDASALPELPAACFIGNPDAIRTAHIRALADGGLPIDVFGNGWEKFLKNTRNVRVHKAVMGREFWQKMRAYRLQINVFRPHNEGSHNMRTFEVPAVGGILLAPDSPEHREFFRPEEEIFLYKTKSEMVEKARQILDLPAGIAADIRRKARNRSLLAGYSYENRAAQAYRAFFQLLENQAFHHKTSPLSLET